VNTVIKEEIEVFIEKSSQFLMQSEAPFLPMQFSLWREVAVEKLQKKLKAENLELNDEVMVEFCEKVDNQLLNKDYHRKIVEVYCEKVKDHQSYVPASLHKYLPLITSSPQYHKLLRCLSEWLALIEQSNDLLHRI